MIWKITYFSTWVCCHPMCQMPFCKPRLLNVAGNLTLTPISTFHLIHVIHPESSRNYVMFQLISIYKRWEPIYNQLNLVYLMQQASSTINNFPEIIWGFFSLSMPATKSTQRYAYALWYSILGNNLRAWEQQHHQILARLSGFKVRSNLLILMCTWLNTYFNCMNWRTEPKLFRWYCQLFITTMETKIIWGQEFLIITWSYLHLLMIGDVPL